MQMLTNLYMILKSVVIAIGRLLYLLLIRLYLIIPVLYVVCIWIASLCVPFKLGDYSTFVVIGSLLCAALSVLLVLRRAMLAPVLRKKSRRTSIVSREEETKPALTEQPAAQPAPAVQSAPPTAAAVYPSQEPTFAEPYAAQPIRTEPIYEGPTAPPYYQQTSKADPKYYRSRRDPSLYIAEYDEYMEFFRKTPEGKFVFLAREDKN